MTRAKDNLHLIVPQRFFAHSQINNGDRHMYASRTRFIPDDILDNFEICVWPFAAEPTPEAVISHEQIDIGARLRRRWRCAIRLDPYLFGGCILSFRPRRGGLKMLLYIIFLTQSAPYSPTLRWQNRQAISLLCVRPKGKKHRWCLGTIEAFLD